MPSASAKQEVLDSVAWRAKYVLDDDVVRYVSIENFKYEDEAADVSASAEDPDLQHILSILVHTSVPFGLAHPDVLKYCSIQSQEDVRSASETDLEVRQTDIIHTILRHLTGPSALPALAAYTPVRTRLVGWEQSQVSRGFYSAEVEGSAATSRGVLSGVLEDMPPAVLLSTPTENTHHSETDAESKESSDLHVISQHSVDHSRTTHPGPLLVLAGDAFTESNFDGCVKSGRFAAEAVLRHLNLLR